MKASTALTIAALPLALAACGSIKAAGPSSSPGTTSAAPSAAVQTLTAPQQKFVQHVRSALSSSGTSNTAVSDAQIAKLGGDICAARQAGGSQASVISAAAGDTESRFSMTSRQFTLAAERAICPAEVQKRQTVTYVVTGSGADVTYGPAGTDLSGSVPMSVTKTLGDPTYYAISAQLQGGGQVGCSILVDGVTISHSTASGSYNIASCEISRGLLSGKWESDEG